MQTIGSRRAALRSTGCAVVAIAAAAVSVAGAQAAERPVGGPPPLPRSALSGKLAAPRLPAGLATRGRKSRVPKARSANLSYLLPGITDCPVMSTGGMNSAATYAPVVRGTSSTDYFLYWTTVIDASDGWKISEWSGPFWLYMGNQNLVYSPYTKSWGRLSDGAGAATFVWPRGYAGIGYQAIQDYQTGKVVYTRARASHGDASGLCSNF